MQCRQHLTNDNTSAHEQLQMTHGCSARLSKPPRLSARVNICNTTHLVLKTMNENKKQMDNHHAEKMTKL